MSEQEDFYTPANVDEQIEHLLHMRDANTRDYRLAHDLQSASSCQPNAEEDARSLERVLGKLLDDDHQQSEQKILPFSVSFTKHKQQERIITPMHSSDRLSREANPRRTVYQRLGVLAATLVVALIVGSMLLVFNAARQHKSVATTNSTQTGSQSQSVGKLGQVVYQSGGHTSIGAIAWSPDSTRMAVHLDGNTVQSWDATSGKHVLNYPVPAGGIITGISWSPDGTSLAVIDGKSNKL